MVLCGHRARGGNSSSSSAGSRKVLSGTWGSEVPCVTSGCHTSITGVETVRNQNETSYEDLENASTRQSKYMRRCNDKQQGCREICRDHRWQLQLSESESCAHMQQW